MNKIDKAVEDLNEYLDTFYTDSEGWMELADIHSSCHQSVSFHSLPFWSRKLSCDVRYTYALQALSHALLLSPQNPFTFLQFAETAYSSGDVPLALKMFLLVIDMSEEEADAIPLGISIRTWWGIKLVRGLDLQGLNINLCPYLLSSAHVSLFIHLHHTTRSRKHRSLNRSNSSTSWQQRGFLRRTVVNRVLKLEA